TDFGSLLSTGHRRKASPSGLMADAGYSWLVIGCVDAWIGKAGGYKEYPIRQSRTWTASNPD
ncbi:unnamed protein product, partial [marine sediment metagenome]